MSMDTQIKFCLHIMVNSPAIIHF